MIGVLHAQALSFCLIHSLKCAAATIQSREAGQNVDMLI